MIPNHAAQLIQAVQHFQNGRLNEAENLLKKILLQQPKNFDALHILGVVKGLQGCHAEAKALLQKALRIDPNNSFVHFNLAKALSETDQDEAALLHHRRATELAPDHAEAWLNFGKSLLHLDKPDEALGCFEKACALQPAYAEAWSNRGECLRRLQRHAEALTSLSKALEINPGIVQAWTSRGRVLGALRKFGKALKCFQQAAALDPGSIDVHFSQGLVYSDMNQHELAIACFDHALAIKPDFALAWFHRGGSKFQLKQFAEALADIDQAAKLPDKIPVLPSYRLAVKRAICDWQHWEEDIQGVLGQLDSGTSPKSSTLPHGLLALPISRRQQQAAAEAFAERFAKIACPYPETPRPGKSDKRIRVGFYSSDLREHPVGQLLVEIIERHDRSRFEFTAFSFNPETQDPLSERLRLAFDRFIDAHLLSDEEVVHLSRQIGIDIAIDLNGYTDGMRTGVFAMRAAPVQVSYLGYAATMGTPFMDYLVTDEVVCPAGSEIDYTEKLVYLPPSFMPHDSTQDISTSPLKRSDFLLPENSFVFCCFNNHNKISPAVFDIWMRLLSKVKDSVLWLSEGNDLAKNNLRKEAASRGVDPARLIFARRMESMADHLARHRLADLFLDTFYYTAHTTACDSLWAGLPVLTCMGETFASRVAASLLTAAGLTELITDDPASYEARALTLATDRSALSAIREKLARNRLATPLFDSALKSRHLESALTEMHLRHCRQLPPAPIHIAG